MAIVVFAVLQAGRKAQMGPSFSVQLLEEADELGLQVMWPFGHFNVQQR
jgi:hypothetical protein